MKKFFAVLFVVMCILGLVGCGGSDKASNTNNKKVESSEQLAGQKSLVVYFSYTGKTACYCSGYSKCSESRYIRD